MPPRNRKPATSYDDIVRRTVPEPYMSFRPTREEEELSRHRFGESTEHIPHHLSRAERDTRDRVRAAVAADSTLEIAGVQIDIDGREIILTGWVPGPATRIRIEELAGLVEGVDAVDNQLEVRPPRA